MIKIQEIFVIFLVLKLKLFISFADFSLVVVTARDEQIAIMQ